MSEEILINVTPTETRVAVVENGMLQEVSLERANHASSDTGRCALGDCTLERQLDCAYDDGEEFNGFALCAGAILIVKALLSFEPAVCLEVLDRVAREGHEIGSHSHDHHHPWLAGPVTALRDALKGFRSLERWVSDEGLFRPPHGKIDMLTWTAVRRRGARLAWWTVDSGDTWGELPQPQQSIDQVVVGNGGIVLMHDSDRDDHHRAYVIELTTKLLELADKRNLDVIPLGALLSRASTH